MGQQADMRRRPLRHHSVGGAVDLLIFGVFLLLAAVP